MLPCSKKFRPQAGPLQQRISSRSPCSLCPLTRTTVKRLRNNSPRISANPWRATLHRLPNFRRECAVPQKAASHEAAKARRQKAPNRNPKVGLGTPLPTQASGAPPGRRETPSHFIQNLPQRRRGAGQRRRRGRPDRERQRPANHANSRECLEGDALSAPKIQAQSAVSPIRKSGNGPEMKQDMSIMGAGPCKPRSERSQRSFSRGARINRDPQIENPRQGSARRFRIRTHWRSVLGNKRDQQHSDKNKETSRQKAMIRGTDPFLPP